MRKKRINAHHHRHYPNVQMLSGVLVCSIGVATLFGWVLDIAALKSVKEGFIAMNPVAAINFIIWGVWVLYRSMSASKSAGGLTGIALTSTALIVGDKSAGLFYYEGLNIEHVLFADKVGPNKLSAADLLNFSLLALALLVSSVSAKQREYLSQALIIVAFAVSSVYLCGYLFNYSSLLGASVLTPMALNSCISFLILSVGMLFTNPDKGFMRPLTSKKLGGVMVRKVLPLLVVIPLLAGGLRLMGQQINLYNTGSGVAIHVVIMAFLAFFLAYYFAKKLNEIDAVRKDYENELLEKTRLLHKSELLLDETASLAKVGGWEVTFPDHQVSYTRQIYTIRELDEAEEDLSFAGAMGYYTPDSAKLLKEHYEKALEDAKPYELELRMITAKKREIWVRVKGRPVCNEHGTVIAIHGTLQDIDEAKNKEILLQQSFDVINEQNKRLMNFTHIVSHNLRTHAANIKSTLTIYDSETNEQEKPRILKMTNQAADALSQTIADLNEIIASQAVAKQLKSSLLFSEVFSATCKLLEKEIKSCKAIISADFSQCDKIEYVPAYLESILYNFLSNAIKYRQPGAAPEIRVSTSVENDRVCMTFSDNGLGIDLQKYGDKLFGMYKTFHGGPDSTGVGLFITKNQVESLGGNIQVESQVNQGTTFKVVF